MSGIACSIIVSGTGLSALTPEAKIDIRSTGKAARVATAIIRVWSFVVMTVRDLEKEMPEMGFRTLVMTLVFQHTCSAVRSGV